jgi:hypothetical protein
MQERAQNRSIIQIGLFSYIIFKIKAQVLKRNSYYELRTNGLN